MKFAECIRAHGVSDFPDPNAKNDFEYGVSVSDAVWKRATTACKDLQPPGTLSSKRTPKQQSASLRLAQCVRANGVKDFPDPVNGEPARQHEQDPILQPARWHDHPQRRDAEVPQRHGRGTGGPRVRRRTWALAAAAVVVAAICGVVVLPGAEHPTAAAQGPAADTVKVERGELSAMVSQGGTLTYRARSDGSPYPVINQGRGVYTSLPETGDKVACGGVLYRVDDKPVLLLCGTVPAYRGLRRGQGPGRPPAQPQPRTSPATRSPRKTKNGAQDAPARARAPTRAERWPSVTRSSCPRRCGSPRSPASSGDPHGREHRSWRPRPTRCTSR